MNDIEIKVQELLVKHLQKIHEGIAARMESMKRNASGRSLASLHIILENSYKGSLEGDEQWNVMQRGRGAGKGPYGFRDIIKEWIHNKGISVSQKENQSQEAALNSAAYLITRSILEKGTTLRRNNGYDDIYDTVVEEELKKLTVDAGAYFELEVDKVNDKFIKE